jgi:RNA polymerase sigma-70 factor (ECF subfamily)
MAELSEPVAGDQSKQGDQPSDDGSSFDAFYLVEFPRMVAWARVLTGDLAIGEELAQEAMVRAYRHWDRVRSYDKPGAWVRRVTANLASSARARHRAERAAVERSGALRAVPELEPDDAAFWEITRRLPRRQRDVVILYYLDDRSVADIAVELGCAENTVKAHLHKARLKLARELGIGS